ncbi:MAG: lactonase family protein, partial [Bdellovibrionota bacterium]
MTQVGSSIIVSSNTLAVHPGGKYVYVLDISGSAIYWYNISPTDGSLSAVGTVSSLSGLKGLAVDPTGTYLYTTDSTPALKVFKIQSDGGITSSSPVAQATFTNQSSITRSVVSPNGKNLFYPTGNTSGMNVFGLNNLDGALISAGGSAISDAAFDPTSTYAYYGVNAAPPNLSACTLQYSSPNTGNVTGCGAVNVSVSVTALALSPTGNFLFAGSAGPAITSFAVSGGTTLTQVGSAFSISNTPQFLAVDPTGKYLIAGLAGSNYKIYSIGTDGSLSGPLSSFGGFPGGMAFVTLY